MNPFIQNFKKFMLIVAIMPGLCSADNLAAPEDPLYNYLELASKNNPAVLQKFSEYEAFLQKVPQVGSLPDPELTLGVFLEPMELLGGEQVADIRLMQMFPWFGTLKVAKDEMSLMAKAKYESLRDVKLKVFFDVQRTWNELYKITQEIRLTEKNIQILKTLERLTLVKFKTSFSGEGSSTFSGAGSSNDEMKNNPVVSSGSDSMGENPGDSTQTSSFSMQKNAMGTQTGGGGLSDLYRVQIEIKELENNISMLHNRKNSVIAKFNSYLNRPVQSPVSFPEALKADTLNVPLFSVSDIILSNNPMLLMLQYEQQSLEARRKMVTRMGYPMLGVGVNYSLINKSEMSTSSMNGKDMIMPMLVVTLPVYRKKYKAMQSEAVLLKNAKTQEYNTAVNDLQAEYYEALALYQDSELKAGLYSEQYLLANKTLDIMLKSFSTSGSGLTDVLRIRQQTLDYELKQINAMADHNTAVAWLKRLMAYSQIP